jgi:hypothetical protein
MKKRICNISWLLALLAVVTLGFTACETDTDSNPTLDLSHVDEGFPLNVPANAENNTYDLANATSLELTCSQPNYGGMPLMVRYYVQVSLTEDFASYKELATSYTTAKMAVDAREINAAMVELFQEANPDTDYPATPRPLYIKLRAVIDGTDNMGETYSNVITLPSVLASYQAPEATFETQLYVVGQAIGEAWSTWKPVPQIYDMPGCYYTVVYVPEGTGFKWGAYEQDWRGYDRIRNWDDVAGADVSASSDGNIVFANGGWYTLFFEAEIVGSSVQYDLHILPAEVYVIGNSMGGNWNVADPTLALQAPADQTGDWVSPAFTGSGELRVYVNVPGYDWWRTEFTLHNGEVYWRDVNIIDSWSELGSDYAVQVSPGQCLYVNFDSNTGEVR